MDRAAKLKALVERGATEGERAAAARALAKLTGTFVVSAPAEVPGVPAEHGYPGRWEEDARGNLVVAFDVPRPRALDFVTGDGVAVKVGEGVLECKVQGVRLRPAYGPSQVIARPIRFASAPAGTLA